MFEYELENYDWEDGDYPSYSYQSSEGTEIKFNTGYNPSDTTQQSVHLLGGYSAEYTGEIVTSEAGRFECLSLNTLSDDVDAFKLLNGGWHKYHVAIISTERSQCFSYGCKE